jgi:hypothetical protein
LTPLPPAPLPPPPYREPLEVAIEPLPFMSIGTGNTGVFILKAKTRLENTYHLLSDDEDESKITPSDEKLSIPINIITSSSDIEFNCTNITANSVYQLTKYKLFL